MSFVNGLLLPHIFLLLPGHFADTQFFVFKYQDLFSNVINLGIPFKYRT